MYVRGYSNYNIYIKDVLAICIIWAENDVYWEYNNFCIFCSIFYNFIFGFHKLIIDFSCI